MSETVLAWPFAEQSTIVDGRFLLHDELTGGAISRCFRANDTLLECPCVLRILAPTIHPALTGDELPRTLFNRAVRNTAKANSTQIYMNGHMTLMLDLGDTAGDLVRLESHPYFATEWLEGMDLKSLIHRHKWSHRFISPATVIAIGSMAARAVQRLHETGISHRDLKPSSLFCQRGDKVATIKLLDFDLSTQHGEEPAPWTGVARYQAPEVLRGTVDDALAPKGDVYSLAAVIYELAVLRTPFCVQVIDAHVDPHASQSTPLASHAREDLPAGLVRLLDHGLSKVPEDRPTAKELADALERMACTLSMPEPDVLY